MSKDSFSVLAVDKYQFVVHIAGPVDPNNVQRCSRCGAVLIDFNGAMKIEGDPDPRRWNTGAFVAVGNRGGSVAIARDASEADEIACTGGIN